jgi:hypothetical protein
MSLLDVLESEMRELMSSRETSPVSILIKEVLAKKRMSRASLAAEAKSVCRRWKRGFRDSAAFRNPP